MSRICLLGLVWCAVLEAETTAPKPVDIEAAQVRWESDQMRLWGGVVLAYDGARLEAPEALVRWESDTAQWIEMEGGVQCQLVDGTHLRCLTAQIHTGTGEGHCQGTPEDPVRLSKAGDIAMAQQLDFQCDQWVLTGALLRDQVHLVQGTEPPVYFTADTAALNPATGELTLESQRPYQVRAWGGTQQLRLQASRLRATRLDGEEPQIEADGSVLFSLTDEQIQHLVAPFQGGSS